VAVRVQRLCDSELEVPTCSCASSKSRNTGLGCPVGGNARRVHPAATPHRHSAAQRPLQLPPVCIRKWPAQMSRHTSVPVEESWLGLAALRARLRDLWSPQRVAQSLSTPSVHFKHKGLDLIRPPTIIASDLHPAEGSQEIPHDT
jgi:hypothetical protein